MEGLVFPPTVDVFARFYIGLSFISVWTEMNLFIYWKRNTQPTSNLINSKYMPYTGHDDRIGKSTGWPLM